MGLKSTKLLYGFAAPPQQVLNGFLHSFLDSSRTNAPFPAVRLPELGLSQVDKRRIRDRSHIMGRHIFADKGEAFIDSQVQYFPSAYGDSFC